MHPTIIGAIVVTFGMLAAAGMSKGSYQVVADQGVAYRMHTGAGAVTICRVIDQFVQNNRNLTTNCADPAR